MRTGVMRISLLRQREAFAEIVAATLRRFWTQRFETDFDVSYSEKSATRRRRRRGQSWLCNDYLNCIFLPQAAGDSFGPIRREYGRSIQRWRTPLQSAYVALATHAISGHWFAHQRFFVSPAVPQIPEQLIVPGNTKIRLISASRRACWVVLKQHFDANAFLTEIQCRQSALNAGVPVPEIEDWDGDHQWLREKYIEGTPVNRLSSPDEESQATQRGYTAILPMIEATLQSIAAAEYSGSLRNRLQGLLQQLPCVTAETRQRLTDVAEELLEKSGGELGEIACSQTHGDFQPGNVLLDGDDIWIIDWEYAGQRMAIYDPMVMGLASRFSRGLAGRILDFIDQGPPTDWPARWPIGYGKNRAERRQLAAFFLTEELILHLQENAKPPITTAGQGLLEMLRQAEQFLAMSKTDCSESR